MTTQTAIAEALNVAFKLHGGQGDCGAVVLRNREMKTRAKLTLPLPPTVNKMYATVNGRRILSKKGREFKQTVKDLVMIGRITPMPVNDVSLTVHIYRARKSGDLDNFLKGLLDSLTGAIWTDDRQVVEIHAYRYEDKANPRAEVEIVEV